MEFKFFPDFKKDHPRIKNKEETERKKKNTEEKITRRDLIKRTAESAATIAAFKATQDAQNALGLIRSLSPEINDLPEPREEPTPRQEKIEQKNQEVIQKSLQELVDNLRKEGEESKEANSDIKTIEPRKEKLSKRKPENMPALEKLLTLEGDFFTPQKIHEKLKEKWLENYSENGYLRNDLEKGFREMQPWLHQIKNCFKEEGVPEKFAFLCLPESHFDLKATSKAQAAGPYQFTKSTATNKICRLRVNDSIDERYDPIKSARACARTLKHLYDFCQDWRLALAGYNGNFIWDYFRHEKTRRKRSYDGFLEYMENYAKENHSMHSKVKNNIDENLNHPAKFEAVYEIIKSGELDHLTEENNLQFVEKKIPGPTTNELISYKVKKGDNLWTLSRQFNTTIDKIKKINKLKNNTINSNQILRIDTSGSNPSLEHYAKSVGHLKRLEKINPSIKNPQAPLPDNFTIRI